MIDELVGLTKQLINQPSVTPNDYHCQDIIAQYLKKLHFNIEPMCFDDTNNIWAYHYGCKKNTRQHTLLFLGHTDIVPVGNIQDWDFPPFSGVVYNDILYGRGASDMKGALAAMLVATKNFITKHPTYTERIAFLITSDEEGRGLNGTTKVIDTLLDRHEHIDYCIIGEPSSQNKIGDTIKNGRRGSYTGRLVVHGSQGHVAYPYLLNNPIHLIAPILPKFLTTTWDQKNSILFPPTSMQITNAYSVPVNSVFSNVTPSKLVLHVNFRFNDQCSIDNIQDRINQILLDHHIDYDIYWETPSELYFSHPKKLSKIVIDIIKNCQNIIPKLETTGGTSDGRFISKTGAEIIELGALNNTIHQANECITLKDLVLLSHMYLKIMEKVLL